MKKIICIIVSFVLLAAVLCGCTKKLPIGQAANEILTYKKLDSSKTVITVSYTGNISISSLTAEFEKDNPDVQVVGIDITGGNKNVIPVRDWIENGLAPDVMFWAGNLITNDVIKNNFTNLSTNSVISSFQSEALNDVAIDANIYCLPCPSDVQCMIYNKTLFDRYGWEVPTTFDQFVTLCDRITADTDGEVEPWNPNAKYSNEFITVMEAFLYEQLFGGADNRSWYDDVIVGKGELAEHIKPLYDAMQTLIDHEILRSDHFSFSATQRTKNFQAGKIAMINGKATLYNSDEYEFAFMPFPSTTEGSLGYVCNIYNAMMGVPLKERDKKTQNAVDRFLAFFASTEGQKTFIGNSLQVSNVKNVTTPTNNVLAPLQASINAGHQFKIMGFSSAEGSANFSLNNDGIAMASGEKTVAECLAAIAAKPYTKYGETTTPEPDAVAEADNDFTILETSFYIADMYREKAGADVGLIENNVAYRGNLMRIFAGKLTADNVTVLLPRSFENGSKLVKATMTGKQLLAALNDPMGTDGATADCVYAYSGLKCTIAPWNAQGERVVSATLADGTTIDGDKLYTVAFWSGTVFEKYLTEITETFEGTWASLMTAKLTNDGHISPSNDGRITLVWD